MEDNKPKKQRIETTTPITSAKPVIDKDYRILNDYKNGLDMNLICARYMVHRTYVDSLVEKHNK